MKIVDITQNVSAAVVEINTTDNRKFWMKIDDGGLHFYSRTSSSGTLESNPISKTADDLFDWIKDCEGGQKRFGDRKDVQPRK